MLKNPKRFPFFQNFRHYETVQNSHFFEIFLKTPHFFFKNFQCLLFLFFFEIFLKTPKSPPSIFRNFATEWVLKISKGPLFHSFRHCEILQKE